MSVSTQTTKNTNTMEKELTLKKAHIVHGTWNEVKKWFNNKLKHIYDEKGRFDSDWYGGYYYSRLVLFILPVCFGTGLLN